MATSVSDGVVDILEDSGDERRTFSLENTSWNRLEAQRHKVVFHEYTALKR